MAINMMVADLPEVMLENVQERQKGVMFLPHLHANHSLRKGQEGDSLLASIQVAAHNKTSVAAVLFYDVWFKVALITCLLIMVLAIILRLMQWKREYHKAQYRILPTVERTRPRSFCKGQTLSPGDNFETTFTGVSVPLLQEVSDV